MYHKQLDDFPEDFLQGMSSVAYQIGGAAGEDGKGPSIWDKYAHRAGDTSKGTADDIAVDHYYHYREDIKSMVR